MANQEHLDILKQGVDVWNQWRNEHPELEPKLYGADLRGSKLRGANFSNADFSYARLGATFYTDTVADLTEFQGANFRGAYLGNADLRFADLTRADLGQTILSGTDLSYARLKGSNLSDAWLMNTQFASTDLSEVIGLETVTHAGPSVIDISTIFYSRGNISEVFLRRAGVPEAFIAYMSSLVSRPFVYYTCFISYSSKDQAFAERLYSDLQNQGVRCWYAPEDLNIGDKIRPRIEESIRLYDKLLIVLSANSIESSWVAYEVERALNKEPQGTPNVLFPIRLDDDVMESKEGWAEDIKRTRHIGDFTHWKNHDDYQKAFNQLLRALKAETKKP